MEVGLVAIWLLACVVLGALGWPLAARLFARTPDRGAALSFPIALAVLTIVAYWIGHLSVRLGLAAGLLVLLAGSILRVRDLLSTGGDDETARERWSRLEFSADTLPVVPAVETAAVFVLAFSVLVAIRAVDPAVHPGGGEKFLDFGLLSSLLRAPRLPPEDFWFAGEPIQYYYGGHLAASLLARLTGTPPRFAYNLALATFYAALVTAAYGLAGWVAADHGASRRAGGALGAVFVGLGSNLVTALYVVVWLLPASIGGAIAGAIADRSALSAEALTVSPADYSYWTASRVIENTVNEFPLFAWLNGDLHAHMMSTPFLLCVAAIGYAYTHTPATDRRRRRLLVFGACPPLVGLLAVINTWSMPAAAGVTWLSLVFGSAHPATLAPGRLADRLLVVEASAPVRELVRVGTALFAAAAVLAGGLVWSLPFWLASASGRGIALFPERSGALALVLVHGAFLAVFVLYLFDRARPSLADGLRAGVALALLVGLALVDGFAALGLFGPPLVVAWLLLRGDDLLGVRTSAESAGGSKRLLTSGGRDRPDLAPNIRSSGRGSLGDVGYETVLLVAGLGLVVLVELAYVDAGAGPGRYNTVFKTYMQVWVLFAVAAGAILARFLASSGVGSDVGLRRRGANVLVALLVVTTSLYAGIALADHFADRGIDGADGPTLDALAFVSASHPGEAPAIRWLDAREGRPTIASAPGTDIYGWVNAPSSLTGVPTVAGWSHEVGYRGADAYDERVADVDRLYTGSPRTQVRLLREYDVQYVYVGPVERERYGAGLDLGDRLGLEIAFRNDAVTIYAVDESRLRR